MVRALVLLVALIVASVPVSAHAQTGQTRLAGAVYDAELYSPILGQFMPFRIYLPPQYFSDHNRRFPVVYMLHGAGGNFTEWSDSFLPEQLDELIVHGVVQPMLAVMPDGGSRTFWANWDTGPQWADYVARDVVDDIDQRFRTIPGPSSRAIGGLSMGGVGALQIGMRHPNVFGAVGAHSPSIRVEPDPELWFLAGDSFYYHDPIWLALNTADANRLIYWLDVGTDDWWRPNIETLHGVLQEAGMNLNWHVFSGTHEAEYWISHVPDYLQFYSAALMGDSPSEPW